MGTSGGHGREILITGCSSGIGLCVAEGLAARGYRVLASARKAADVERLNAAGLECLRLDLDDPENVEAALDEVFARTGGRLYALFNNGAYGQPGALEDLPREALRCQFETNVFGWMQVTRRVIPVMRAAGRGRIVQNSSVLGLVALPYRGAYTASKYAVEGLTDTLRLELRGSGIHVSLIEPGPVTSRFRENARTAFQRFVDPQKSVHRDAYASMQGRLTRKGAAVPFTLPPEAVLKRVVHALESPRPRLRYPVTVPTYVFAWARRLLSGRALDSLITRLHRP